MIDSENKDFFEIYATNKFFYATSYMGLGPCSDFTKYFIDYVKDDDKIYSLCIIHFCGPFSKSKKWGERLKEIIDKIHLFIIETEFLSDTDLMYVRKVIDTYKIDESKIKYY